MPPWNDWYHITGNTYGAWLPGDPRGWKTRHARPQPAAPSNPHIDTSQVHSASRRLMTSEPVTLSVPARQAALTAILEAFRLHNIETITIAVADHHFHTLSRVPDHEPRKWAGIAKKESARALSRAALADPGGVWAARSHCKTIRDREHQLEVVRYILSHASEGAAVWTSWPTPPPPST